MRTIHCQHESKTATDSALRTALSRASAWRTLNGAQRRRLASIGGVAIVFAFCGTALGLISRASDRAIVQRIEGRGVQAAGGPVSQEELTALVVGGENDVAFEHAFEVGDELFGGAFNAADGSGANVGKGMRFTRMPRADLNAAQQWASHTPARATGPNAVNCTDCHNKGGDDGAGAANTNVHRDATHSGMLGQMVQRNTPHVFGIGALQKLGEEMTAELQAAREQGRADAGCGSNRRRATTVNLELASKGIDFGELSISHPANSARCRETLRASEPGAALAVSPDLVVRPFQWKGSVASIREFVRGAAHNEVGMQAVEFLGSPTVDPASVDGDGDGVVNELQVGDITALAIYQAGQPRPSTKVELASLGLIPELSAGEANDILAGFSAFQQVGCASCHTPSIVLDNSVYSEPSRLQEFRDAGDRFPNGLTYASAALDINNPIEFDLTVASLENGDIVLPNGQKLGSFIRDDMGRAVVELFGDLRRHEMGAALAEEVDEVGTGKSVFMTENLWGVGSTAPYLHDGRATTLAEAILEHGGEADASRRAFIALSDDRQRQLVAFLNNLVLFKAE